ncbi:MAG TPA: restriction endonuclease subunit S [Casimicrobium sp.]|nr:restriction endonuclease subunit S [Casimicrobium sp.]
MTELPPGWESKQFFDVVALQRGFDLPMSARRAGSVVVLGSNGQVGTHDECRNDVPVPTLTVGRSGSVGKVCFSEAGAWPLNTTLFAKDYRGNDPKYINFWLQHFDLSRYAQGVSVPTLNRNSFSSIQVHVPPLSKQQRIARVLDRCWDGIRTEQTIEHAASELKSAAMNELFTRGLRGETQKETEIGWVPESWSVDPLGAHHSVCSGGTPARGNPTYWTDGNIPWVKTTEVNYCLISKTEEQITQSGLSESAARLLPEGTLLMAMYGQGVTRGRVAILGIEAACNQACAAISATDSTVLGKYLYHFLTWRYEAIRQLAHGGQQQNLNLDIVRALPIASPNDADEQLEIVAVLDALDHKIALHQQKRAVLEELFKALLHKLMTGEIDVNDLELTAVIGLNNETEGSGA